MQTPDWMISDAGERLFRAAKARLYRLRDAGYVTYINGSSASAAGKRAGSSTAKGPSKKRKLPRGAVTGLTGDDDEDEDNNDDNNSSSAKAKGSKASSRRRKTVSTAPTDASDDEEVVVVDEVEDASSSAAGSSSGGDGACELDPTVSAHLHRSLHALSVLERTLHFDPRTGAGLKQVDMEVVLEANPKWDLLGQVAEEVAQAWEAMHGTSTAASSSSSTAAASAGSGGGTDGVTSSSSSSSSALLQTFSPGCGVLIAVKDDRSGYQVRDVLVSLHRRKYATADAAASFLPWVGAGGAGAGLLKTAFSRYLRKQAARTRGLRDGIMRSLHLVSPPPHGIPFLSALAKPGAFSLEERELLIAAEVPGWPDAAQAPSSSSSSATAASSGARLLQPIPASFIASLGVRLDSGAPKPAAASLEAGAKDGGEKDAAPAAPAPSSIPGAALSRPFVNHDMRLLWKAAALASREERRVMEDYHSRLLAWYGAVTCGSGGIASGAASTATGEDDAVTSSSSSAAAGATESAATASTPPRPTANAATLSSATLSSSAAVGLRPPAVDLTTSPGPPAPPPGYRYPFTAGATDVSIDAGSRLDETLSAALALAATQTQGLRGFASGSGDCDDNDDDEVVEVLPSTGADGTAAGGSKHTKSAAASADLLETDVREMARDLLGKEKAQRLERQKKIAAGESSASGSGSSSGKSANRVVFAQAPAAVSSSGSSAAAAADGALVIDSDDEEDEGDSDDSDDGSSSGEEENDGAAEKGSKSDGDIVIEDAAQASASSGMPAASSTAGADTATGALSRAPSLDISFANINSGGAYQQRPGYQRSGTGKNSNGVSAGNQGKKKRKGGKDEVAEIVTGLYKGSAKLIKGGGDTKAKRDKDGKKKAAADASAAATGTSSAATSSPAAASPIASAGITLAPRLSTVIYPLTRMDGRACLLSDLRPTFIIQFDPDPQFTREIEVYRASQAAAAAAAAAKASASKSSAAASAGARSGGGSSSSPALPPLRLYMLTYINSTEEQKFLSAVRKEQKAFEKLIATKSHMAPPAPTGVPGGGSTTTDVTGAVVIRKGGKDAWGITWDQSKATVVANLGSSGGTAGALAAMTAGASDALITGSYRVNPATIRPLTVDIDTPDKGRRVVIVDQRELRAKLPMRLYTAGLEIVPITLEVGDFILSPEIAVERKSLPDLLGSLNSGRLYTQAEAMTRAYNTPVLAIEWDEDRPFALQPGSDVPTELEITNPLSKLVLLTLHFPTLRILWCRSPASTAVYFAALKQAHEEPDPAVAASIGSDGTILEKAAAAGAAAAAAVTAIGGAQVQAGSVASGAGSESATAAAEDDAAAAAGVAQEGAAAYSSSSSSSAAIVPASSDVAAPIATSATAAAAAPSDNYTALAMLSCLPGVNAVNVKALRARISCLADLPRLTEGELGAALGPGNAALLHHFLHARNAEAV